MGYHVVAASVFSKDIAEKEYIKTVEGDYVTAAVIEHGITAGIYINGAKVTTANLAASNGVVHVIDTVLVPPGMPPMPAPTKNIVELAVATPDLSTLVAALKAASLVDTPEGAGPFTVFAPTNEAFAKLSPAILEQLFDPRNVKTLQKLLTYHVAAGAVLSKDITDNEKIKTVEGQDVVAHVTPAGIKINDAAVTTADVLAANGVVHLVDTVLMPSDMPSPPVPTKNIVELAAATPDLSTLVAALGRAQLVDTLKGAGPFTVFAPTNEAFAKLPPAFLEQLLEPKNVKILQKVLTYHVAAGAVVSKNITDHEQIKTVEGQDVVAHVTSAGIKINDAAVTTADVLAVNGVVHVIDTVLVPPGMPPMPAPTKNIVELAVATPDLSTLVAALKAASLVDTLEGAGPFTVFAPTNKAFAKLPALYRELLFDPKNVKTLQKLLTYHVASAAVFSKDITDNEKIKTIEGEIVTAHTTDGSHGGIKINDAAVKVADQAALNGVVHLIDTVLMPSGMPPQEPTVIPL